MKTAFLVDFSLRTRVIVDLPDGTKPETATLCGNTLADKVKEAAIRKILANPKSYLEDNLENIVVDEKCPYPCGKEEEIEKKADEWFTQADFKTMEAIFGIRHEDFDEEDGYQAFVDECENRWGKMDLAAKTYFYAKHS